MISLKFKNLFNFIKVLSKQYQNNINQFNIRSNVIIK